MSTPDRGDLHSDAGTRTIQTDSELREAIAGERRALADTLRALQPTEWDTPSLCGGWAVRDVVAHLTMPYRQSTLRTIVGVLKAGGNFNTMADRVARHDAATMSPAQLTAYVADNINNPWKPPGGGNRGALTHDVVHGLDITVPLGRDCAVAAPALVVALEEATSPRAMKHFGADLSDVALQATDSEFTFGAGQSLKGATSDLLLVLCGRKLPAGRLNGVHAARFEQA